MVRSVLTALTLAVAALSSPAPAMAQQSTQTHVVAPGETLAVLAERYLGDYARWQEILDANGDLLSDPADLAPGMELVIPAPPTSRIQRMEQAEARPTREGRSRFYGNDVGAGQPMQVSGDRIYQRHAVPEDVFYSAEWLVSGAERPTSVGTLSEFVAMEGARRFQGTTARPFDRIQMDLAGAAPRPGQELQVFRVVREIPGLGWVVRPTGSVTVIRNEGETSVVEVLRQFDNMSLGDLVRPIPTFPLERGVEPRDVEIGSESATILEWGDPHQLQQYGDVAFLDRGARDGVRVGDEYVVAARTRDGYNDRVAGRLQVVGVEDDVASARIIQQDGPVFSRGTQVYLARKMQ